MFVFYIHVFQCVSISWGVYNRRIYTVVLVLLSLCGPDFVRVCVRTFLELKTLPVRGLTMILD